MNLYASPHMEQVEYNRDAVINRPSIFYQNGYQPIQHPPTACINHAKRISEAQRTDTTRVQSSISSGGSGSSGISYQKQFTPPRTYSYPPSPEQQYMASDPEKIESRKDRSSPRQSVSKSEMTEARPSVIRYIEEQRRIQTIDEDDEDHAPWVLFWLSILDPFHSMLGCIYTLIITLLLVLLSPLRLCRNQVSFGDRIIRLLAPLYRHHLQMMYAPSVERAFSFEFKPTALISVLLASPFVSLGVAAAAWVSAAFWVFAFIMGNPDGTERRDDGRDAVLSVRNWWETYFLYALKNADGLSSTV